MIKLLIIFLLLTTNSFASDCKDLGTLVSIYKLKDIISNKGDAISNEIGRTKKKVSPYSYKIICEDDE